MLLMCKGSVSFKAWYSSYSYAVVQVELNTIASSFGCLSTLVSRMHKHILERSARPDVDLSNLPANEAMDDIADGIGAAVREFGSPDAVALFIVQPSERNSYDQQVCFLASLSI